MRKYISQILLRTNNVPIRSQNEKLWLNFMSFTAGERPVGTGTRFLCDRSQHVQCQPVRSVPHPGFHKEYLHTQRVSMVNTVGFLEISPAILNDGKQNVYEFFDSQWNVEVVMSKLTVTIVPDGLMPSHLAPLTTKIQYYPLPGKIVRWSALETIHVVVILTHHHG